MKQQNVIEEVRDQLKYLFLHRKGNDAHAAVQDVIDAIWSKDPKPKILKKIKLSNEAYKFLISLGPGLGYKEFKAKEQLFADAMGGTVQVEKRGKVITMQASTTEIKREYPYCFDPSQHKGYLPRIPSGPLRSFGHWGGSQGPCRHAEPHHCWAPGSR